MEKLEVRGVSKCFDGAPVLEDISITLRQGELVCLLGVPSLASWVITSAGASDVNRNIAQTAQKAAMLAGK